MRNFIDVLLVSIVFYLFAKNCKLEFEKEWETIKNEKLC